MDYLDKIYSFRRHKSVKIFLVFVLLASLFVFLRPLKLDYYPDFSSYYYGAQTIFNGGNPYLGGEMFFGPFLYPPFALLFFLPFTFVSFVAAEKIFVVISMLCLFLSLYLLFKLFKISILSFLSIILLIFVFNFFPEKFTLGMGQINNVILLFLSIFIYSYIKKRNIIAGIFLALAIMLKVSPLVLVIFLLIDKQWKILCVTGISMMVMTLLVVVFVDPTINIYFLKNVLPTLATSWKIDYYNQALSGFIQREIPGMYLQQILRTSLGLLLLVGSFVTIWINRSKNDNTRLLSISILLTLSLIINSFSWQHHFVWLLIPFLITLMLIKDSHLHLRYYIFLGISFILVAINLKDPSMVPSILQSHVLYGALLLCGLDMYLLISGKNLIARSWD